LQQPPGYEDKHTPRYVCKLDKTLYGLKQAPRAWYSKISTKLKSLGFKASKPDSSLLFYSDHTCTIYVLIYVDDIIVVSSDEQFMNKLVKKLNQQFPLTDLGYVHYFLTIEVTHTRKGLLMAQERYARDILQRANMTSCKVVSTCDRTTSKMKGLSPKIISGDSRRSENAQTHANKHTIPNMKFKLKLLQIKCHVLGFTEGEAQNALQKIIRVCGSV
jgi:hypothetical protein